MYKHDRSRRIAGVAAVFAMGLIAASVPVKSAGADSDDWQHPRLYFYSSPNYYYTPAPTYYYTPAPTYYYTPTPTYYSAPPTYYSEPQPYYDDSSSGLWVPER